MIMIRVEDTDVFNIMGNTISNIENLSVAPFATCDDYHVGASSENANELQAGNIRMISAAAVRGPSKIKNNVIGLASSNSASNPLIVGIDIQGDSEGISIEHNHVDLEASHGNLFDPNDEFISVRIREDVHSSVSLANNNELKQESQVLNGNRIRGRKLKAHPNVAEWQVGGCPFAQVYAKK